MAPYSAKSIFFPVSIPVREEHKPKCWPIIYKQEYYADPLRFLKEGWLRCMVYHFFVLPHFPSSSNMKCGLDKHSSNHPGIWGDLENRSQGFRWWHKNVKRANVLDDVIDYQSCPRRHITGFIYRREWTLICLSFYYFAFSITSMIHQWRDKDHISSTEIKSILFSKNKGKENLIFISHFSALFNTLKK